MSFKTKAVALLAGSALALSVASGAMAQSGTSVLLEDDSSCEASLSGIDVNFGTYAWNGTDAYELVDGTLGNTDVMFTVQAPQGATCDVTFSEGDMTHETDTTKVIAVEYTSGVGNGNPLTLENVPADEWAIGITIDSTLDNAYIAGDYSGTIQIDSGASSS